ncbi:MULTISPECIES: Lrp/AsnC family transcriptional regulator [unclassified Bradyrhizobium]|uniref:Lrp/AsnC family transcriptional regulator n=1 Tax=unclassified Bradyrhizobium TaxID=2631580 RepID=UPI001CD740BD|nr:MULTISPECIES: Lrp/AsnC family transcriptional regulator [unclassified Bradyrhizobium]
MSDAALQLAETGRRLDAIDRKILTVLQEDASLSVAEIGDRVGLSSTPCWKRIQRLEADGVILKRVALVDQNKIGLGLSVFVSMESSDHSDGWLKRFAAAVSAIPEVMEEPADASSSVDAEETVPTISPMAASKASASRRMSDFRYLAEIRS